jgi:hypothetical protein
LLSTSALAQELPRETPPPPPAPTVAREWTPDANARGRGRGALMIALGSVLLPVGASMAGASAPLWDLYRPDCRYSCPGTSDVGLSVGLTLDVLGFAFMAGGTALISLGAQTYTTHKLPAR